MREAVEGPTVMVKDVDVVTEKLPEETAVWPPDVIVMVPLPAPAGTTNESAFAEEEDTGAEMLPPVELTRVT
jgi:hypothetical protein